MSVEAACALSLFLFFMISLLAPMKVMDIHRQMQAALESAGEDAARYAYVTYRMEQGKDISESNQQWKEEYLHGFATKAAVLAGISYDLNRRCAGYPVEDLRLAESEFMNGDDDIDLVLRYKVRLPFSMFGVKSIPQMCRCRRRAWIGRDGGKEKEDTEEKDSDELVYIGRNGTRYHRDRYCHYLYNDLKAVSKEEVESLRNAGGGIYHACSRCGSTGGGAMVYIMPSGDKYHSDPGCSAIIAYVQEARLSEVEYLGSCSYCSGGKGGI
ncbi:hypothetical protein GPL15_06485 [Clostridium sp. MCC353]|uniref:hypothetical protein n=1 Tax=Clostridium sp. MCC353 TaxID=2592646 RepID=UPI001C0393EC|nr:hypothetical protein [Clostridium sp. MCC353]MBT9776152.1 hypothetical protein [Clostridium sp. MCC353]